MPFDPDKYLADKAASVTPPSPVANGFDPDAYLAAKQQPASGDISAPTSAFLGNMQWRTGNMLDEALGAFHNPKGALKEAGKFVGMAPGADADAADYRTYRDKARAALESSNKQHPVASTVGGVAAGLGSVAGGGFLANAAQGGLQALGSSTANDAGGLAKDVAKEGLVAGTLSKIPGTTLLGAGAGAYFAKDDLQNGNYGKAALKIGAGGLGGLALDPRVISYLKNAAKGTARAATLEHLRPTANMRRAIGDDGAEQIADAVLDSGALKAGTKIKDTAAALDDKLTQLGKEKGDIIANAQGPINPQVVADQFNDQVINPMKATSRGTAAAPALEAERDAFLNQYSGGLTPVQLDAEKKVVQAGNNYLSTSGTANLEKQGMKGWGSVLRQSVEDVAPAVKPVNEQYSKLADALTMADRTKSLAHDGMGMLGHMTDVAVAENAARDLSQGRLLGPALGAARALTRGKVSSTVAVGANKLSTGLGNYQSLLEKAAPILSNTKYQGMLDSAAQKGSLPAAHFVLWNRDPQYRQLLEKVNESGK